MSTLILAIGLVLSVEGLIMALLPGRLEDVLKLIASLSPDLRRGLGLAALAFGVALIWLAKDVVA